MFIAFVATVRLKSLAKFPMKYSHYPIIDVFVFYMVTVLAFDHYMSKSSAIYKSL